MPDTSTIKAKNYRVGRRKRIRASVVHTMQAPEKGTTAESCAHYFAGTYVKAPMASAHRCHDNNSTVRCVADQDTAFAAPGLNEDGLQHECAGFAEQGPTEWMDPYSLAVIDRLAQAVAEDCFNHNLPPNWLSVADIKAGKKGITSHNNVSEAYGLSSHWDPGPHFPVAHFIGLVRKYLAILQGKAPAGSAPQPIIWRANGVMPDGSPYNVEAVKFLQQCANIFQWESTFDGDPVGDGGYLEVDGKYGDRTAARIGEIEKRINDIMWISGARKGFLMADGVTTDKTCEYLGNFLKLFASGRKAA